MYNDYTTNPWLSDLISQSIPVAPAKKKSIMSSLAGTANGAETSSQEKPSGGLGSLLDGAIPGLSEVKEGFDWLTGMADKEENKKIARASWSAEQGPAMLKMIQDMAKRQDENRFRSTGLSTLAGR